MKIMNVFIMGIAVLAMLGINISGAQAGHNGNGYGKQKVVYHINYPGGEGDKAYLGALKNIQNHINAVGAKNLDLKVVIHGNGIFLLKSAKDAGALQTAVGNLKSQNIAFNVCANTLKGKKISVDQLYEVFDEDVVPSGVAELAHLQADGYTYIKP
ncbi:MAG: DsrE family protein [Rhodospirillaceae bacterium]|nr:DsrE family protein [Rhodospirillaceae bacterium]